MAARPPVFCRNLRRSTFMHSFAPCRHSVFRDSGLAPSARPGMTVALLQILRAPFHRLVPHLGAVEVEDQAEVLLRGEPGAQRKLAFELARPPAGVTERNEAFVRAV